MLIDDQSLPGIAALLFDEFHERSLDGDLGLALALDAQAGLREELRLIVMSATLDDVKVAQLMGDAPIVRSMGRSFPIETRYRPRAPHQRIEDATRDAILSTLASEPGSILVFLPGAGEIEGTRRRLSETALPADVDIVPLYGALEAKTQREAIRPPLLGKRKVVLATSIAETSLTIEGVRVVIDSGLARIPRFDPASGLTRLETVRASRAAIDQRRGRAGRTEPGICIRLWQEAETRALPAFATPQIKEADLAPLLLDCAACGVTDPGSLRFLDPPPAAASSEARTLLVTLGALLPEGRMTAHGAKLASLPLPPRLAHMLVGAADEERMLAALIALILGERGLGGTDTHLIHRLHALAADRSEQTRRAIAMAERWVNLLGIQRSKSAARPNFDKAGALLALAYPDRIAQARPDKPGEFVLANGRGAALDPALPLAREPFLIVADLAGSEQRARILLACPISKDEIIAILSDQIVSSDDMVFDLGAKAVRARRSERLGRLVLSERNLPAEGEAAHATFLAGIAMHGLHLLPWTPTLRQLLDRGRFLSQANPIAWPGLDDETLLSSLTDWLSPYIPGCTRMGDITHSNFAAAIDGLFAGRRQQIEAEAPAHFAAPTGSQIAIDYHPERGPVVAIRVQELFGLTRHPMLAGGAVPITFDLLSPAQRPIQTTRDIPRFWAGSWADVRAQMRGRYPKHSWPEDPAQALPTKRAKPRGT